MSDVSAPATPSDDEIITRKILREEQGKLELRVDGRFDKVEASLDKLETKFNKLETKFDKLETKFDKLETKVDKLETKVDKLETKVDKLDTKVDTHFGMLVERVNTLETSLRALVAYVRTLPEEFARQARAISEEARGWVKAVDEKYADLPDRIAQLEAQSDE